VSEFHFKQFSVAHEKSAMKVGTDAVLIGSWAFQNVSKAEGRGLDVGCGCGVITLMMAQRFPGLQWTGMDLNTTACTEAKSNFERSPFHPQLSILQGDFALLSKYQYYDLIICNPPYYQDLLKAELEDRNMARQEKYLPPTIFLQTAFACSTEEGKVAVVLPLDRKSKWLEIAEDCGWKLERCCEVSGNVEATASRYLLQWGKSLTEKVEYSELALEQSRGQRTQEYQKMTEDFYL
jgi:tRNA1Val (adenine37-N6)-methyltransferase